MSVASSRITLAFAVTAAAACVLAAPVVARAGSSSAWVGVDFAPDSYFTYAGGVTALSGQDITRENGLLLRGAAGFGEYHYSTGSVAGRQVDTDLSVGELMLGYGFHFPLGSVSVYAGGNIERHDASPKDPGNAVHGTKEGAKASADLQLKPLDDVTFNASAAYSSAFRSYWSRADVSYDVGAFSIGPEATLMGNQGFEQTRLGLLVSDIAIGSVAKLRLYGGLADNAERGDDGLYAGVGFGFEF